mgnify:CR=1 FL=1
MILSKEVLIVKDLNEMIKEIDAKIEEIKNDPSYNEEEGKEQLRKMQDYIKEHPKTSEEIIKSIDQKIIELENK